MSDMSDNQPAESSAPKAKKTNYWLIAVICIAISALMFWYAPYMYHDLDRWEQTGGTRSMNAGLMLLYNIGGKSGVYYFAMAIAVVASCGVVYCISKAIQR
jgi:hypothetical protein